MAHLCHRKFHLFDPQRDQYVINAIGKSLNLSVIAEVIETLDQTNFLTQKGWDEGQGSLYSRHVSANKIEAMLKNNRTS